MSKITSTSKNEPECTTPRILLYLGGSDGYGIANILKCNNYHQFTEMHIFEAQKESYEKLKQMFGNIQNIYVNFGAVVPEKGSNFVKFNICDKNGSSSLGTFDPSWENFKCDDGLKMVDCRIVPAIYLPDYCDAHNIREIDTYISDLQGSDLAVLRSMKPFIYEKRIRQLQCEVTKNGKRNIYKDLENNELQSFEEFLGTNYKLSSIGWVCGILPLGIFFSIPENWWECDVLWIRN